VAVADGKRYVGPNFRDPYVFYCEPERCWWLLVTAEVPGPIRFRAGCVGLYKSPNLLDWQAADPLWSPGLGPRHECPQVIRHKDRWYLFDLERQDQYRIARSLAGPWQRPHNPGLGSHTVLTGSRLASDGKRWVSFPFLCAQRDNNDFGEVVQAELYAIPRQFDFRPDGRIAQRPIVELIDALHALPSIPPLAPATPVAGRWQFEPDGARASCLSSSGTLALPDLPANVYVEADVTLSRANMEAALLFRVDAELTRGYKLTFHPGDRLVSLRPFSYWDRDRVLVAQPAALLPRRAFKVRLFVSGTVVEAFVDDRVVLSTRIYRHAEGGVALEVADGPARFDRLVVRALAGDTRPEDARR
jgi:beta-fructofuranosidase